MTDLQALLDEVVRERRRQDVKWGRKLRWRSHSDWLPILGEEFGEVSRALTEYNAAPTMGQRKLYSDRMRRELIHVAAVALSWLELGRKP